MKKALIVTSLLAPAFVFAQSTGTSTPVTTGTGLASTTVTCVQTALDKRENAIIGGHDAYNTAVKTALTKRLESLKTAWAQTDRKSRNEKKNEAYKTFKSDVQTANTALRVIRNGAWKTFETEAKACGVKGGTGETPSMVGGANITL